MVSSRRRRALSLRHSSTRRREATVSSHDRGSSGTPCLGPLLGRGEQRLLHGVLARVELPVAPDQRAEDLRRELAQQVLDRGARRPLTGRTVLLGGVGRPLHLRDVDLLHLEHRLHGPLGSAGVGVAEQRVQRGRG